MELKSKEQETTPANHVKKHPLFIRSVVILSIFLFFASVVSASTFSDIMADWGLFSRNVTIGNGTTSIEMNGTTGMINTTGNISADTYYGDGSKLTGISGGSSFTYSDYFNQDLNTSNNVRFRNVKVGNNTQTTLGTDGLLLLDGNYSGAVVAVGASVKPVYYGPATFAVVLGNPIMRAESEAQLFRFTPLWPAKNNRTATALYFAPPTHAINLSEDYRLTAESQVTRSYFAFNDASRDFSTVDYRWFEHGGAVQFLDLNYELPDYNEVIYHAKGGATRTAGTSGSINQQGFKCTGFGTMSGLTSSDNVECFSSDGGIVNLTGNSILQSNDYYSGDGTQGMTGTCGSGTTLTVKDGLITGCS